MTIHGALIEGGWNTEMEVYFVELPGGVIGIGDKDNFITGGDVFGQENGAISEKKSNKEQRKDYRKLQVEPYDLQELLCRTIGQADIR